MFFESNPLPIFNKWRRDLKHAHGHFLIVFFFVFLASRHRCPGSKQKHQTSSLKPSKLRSLNDQTNDPTWSEDVLRILRIQSDLRPSKPSWRVCAATSSAAPRRSTSPSASPITVAARRNSDSEVERKRKENWRRWDVRKKSLFSYISSWFRLNLDQLGLDAK